MSDYIQKKKFNTINKTCSYNECQLLMYNKSNMVIGNYGVGKFSSTPTSLSTNDIIQNSIGNQLSSVLSLAMFEKLSAVASDITQLTYNFSIGNFDYIYKVLTNEKYLQITNLLYETRAEVFVFANNAYNKHILGLYNNIRSNIVRSFEGFMLSSTQYSNFEKLKELYKEAQKAEEILKDMKKLQEYLDNLKKKNSTIFPDSTIEVTPVSIKPVYMRYIELYGIPVGLNFDVDLLGKLEAEMEGR